MAAVEVPPGSINVRDLVCYSEDDDDYDDNLDVFSSGFDGKQNQFESMNRGRNRGGVGASMQTPRGRE